MKNTVLGLLALTLLYVPSARAQDKPCTIENRACVLGLLQGEAAKIDTPAWRDQTYRELAKTLAFDGQVDEAIALVSKIETPDTQAMTIRGIGMAAADNRLSLEEYKRIFAALRAEAEKIKHPPSYAIALTYIAMAQAFARDNEGSWATASSMENASLRHKAYGETAEIQAAHGDFAAAMKSIGFIDSAAYQNKAYANVSKILADKGQLSKALEAARKITNPYKQAEALQYVLDIQKPREVSNK